MVYSRNIRLFQQGQEADEESFHELIGNGVKEWKTNQNACKTLGLIPLIGLKAGEKE